MLRNEKIKVEIIDNDYNGQGIAKVDGLLFFVAGAIKGETVIAKVGEVHKSLAFGETVKVIEASKERIEPTCKHYYQCGGCDLMHISSKLENELKEAKVVKTLKKVANIDTTCNPIIENLNPWGYRNKVLIPYQMVNNEVKYGFFAERSHKLIPMEKCLIEPKTVGSINAFIKEFLENNNVSIYNEEAHTGLFREVMIRVNYKNEAMVVLVSTAKNKIFSLLALGLSKAFKEIVSIYLNVNSKATNVVLSDNYELLSGVESITEDILGLKFQVLPASFLQVNHDQSEKLYQEAFRLAKLDRTMNVIDAYCGIGSITLNIAKQVNHVYGIEVVEAAVINANQNKKVNNIDNATFILGKCEEQIKKLVKKTDIDVIFFDPPRKGCDLNFLKAVIEMKIPRIVYISCNISTAARDIKILTDSIYEFKEITPVDLFTHTSHVESVILLEKKKPVNENKLKYIPKADIEMMVNDKYEESRLK